MTVDSEREVLAQILAEAYSATHYRDAHLRGADAILAAGYRRQESESTVWRDRDGNVWREGENNTTVDWLILDDPGGPVMLSREQVIADHGPLTPVFEALAES